MLKKCIVALFALTALLTTASATPAPADGLRGIWVPSVLNLDYPTKQNMTEQQLKAEADSILDNIQSMGLNAVFLQVRPSADSLYPSSIFPWSVYLTGTQGQAPAGGFDPLAYWVEGAHRRGLQLHAWLNPYRITKNGTAEWNAMSTQSPAKQHSEWVIWCDGNYYFDPGLPAVQQLVTDGAAEIVRNYDVDGIHLDDYFYPSTDFDDADTFARYGSGFSNLADWRRNNVNTLVAKLDTELHAIDPALSFGISPAGIWDNRSSNPLGSDTAGRSSYREIYCDTLHWINTGTVDYVCPQIYWNIGYRIADFSILLNWWENAIKDTDVALYIGMGAYRMEDAEPGETWYGTAELARQLDLIAGKGTGIGGVVFYRYRSFLDTANASVFLRTRYQAFLPALQPELPQIDDPDFTNPALPMPSFSESQQAASLSDLFSRMFSSLC